MIEWPTAKLREIADNLADDLTKQIPGLEAAVAKMTDDLHKATGAKDRAETFQPKIEDELQCPKCWIRDGTAGKLYRIDFSVEQVERIAAKIAGKL